MTGTELTQMMENDGLSDADLAASTGYSAANIKALRNRQGPLPAHAATLITYVLADKVKRRQRATAPA